VKDILLVSRIFTAAYEVRPHKDHRGVDLISIFPQGRIKPNIARARQV
jgi:hypothetical protein